MEHASRANSDPPDRPSPDRRDGSAVGSTRRTNWTVLEAIAVCVGAVATVAAVVVAAYQLNYTIKTSAEQVTQAIRETRLLGAYVVTTAEDADLIPVGWRASLRIEEREDTQIGFLLFSRSGEEPIRVTILPGHEARVEIRDRGTTYVARIVEFRPEKELAVLELSGSSRVQPGTL